MRSHANCFFSIALATGLIFIGIHTGEAQFPVGEKAPLFSLKDMGGTVHDLSTMEKQPMVILYFFDVDSKPSQDGLLSLRGSIYDNP